jgi:excisionase family DNA binding protein
VRRKAVDHVLLKVVDVARLLSVSRSKAYELVSSGRLQSVKVDGCRRVRSSDLEQFIANLPSDPPSG